MNKLDYLNAFRDKADLWFKSTSVVEKYHVFFQKFFAKEHLEIMEWKDIQELGEHLHAANSLALTKKRAFGNPNHPIEHYRKSFIYLAYGNDSVRDRVQKFAEDEKYEILGFGPAIISELAAQIFPEEFVIYNSRSKSALSLLGIEVERKRGETKIDEFFKFNELVKPLVNEYKNIIGKKTNLPINFEVDQFFSFLYESYKQELEEEEETELENDLWIFAPGENAKYIDDARKGLIHIGWDDLGNLNDYSTVGKIKKALGKNINGKEQVKNARTCFHFAYEMQIGNVVFLRDGRNKIIGKAIIDSDYYFDDNRPHHKHCRKIKDFVALDIKTYKHTTMFAVAPLSVDSELYKEIIGVIGDGDKKNEECSYFWLNANPKVWDIDKMQVGETQYYTALNENGKKRRIYDCFESAKEGDLVIGYNTSPIKKATCILEIITPLKHENGKDVLYFKKIRDLNRPVDLIEMQNTDILKDAAPLLNNQGSIFPLKKDEYYCILGLSDDVEPENENPDGAEYSIEDLNDDVFLDDLYIRRMMEILERKKNIVLQGPPGVGKSFLAKKIASAFVGKIESDSIRFIQFHQSYSYEEFVQGLRPEEGKAQTFKLKNGIFYETTLDAIKNPKKRFVLIIDEINRGNLSKIFGELLYLIEGDKRGSEHRIRLANSRGTEDQFYVPDNLFIIGTMNTADRSLALVDYALRRRFSFFDIKPSFHTNKFSNWMKAKGLSEKLIDHICSKISELNKEISENSHELGSGFCIGHSYFQSFSQKHTEEEWLDQVLEYDIRPLLLEYWFSDEEKVEKEFVKLKL